MGHLIGRIARLEARNPDWPYARLTDDALAARSGDLTAQIEDIVGMSMAAYVDGLTAAAERNVHDTHTFPKDLSKMDVQRLYQFHCANLEEHDVQ